MKSRVSKLCLVLFTMLFVSVAAFAQKTVTGVVVDDLGDPIIGANVVIKGTQEGTMTDADGNFSIKNVSDNAVLRISFMGYADQDVSVKGQSKIKVTMQEDSQMLDEVVMVGYGVQRKVDVTGATARVGAREITAMPVANAFEGMQGKVAGVDIQNSQRPGEVGNIQIRGERTILGDVEPLYVVDGAIVEGGIGNINPQDIESIDILKDASSTAIYGSRGANGVVIVTTKRGKEGKVSVNYAGNVTFSWLYDVADMMTASEWLDYARMAKYNSVDKNGNRSYNSTLDSNGKVIPVYAQDKGLWGSVPASWANIEKAWAGGTYDASKVGSYDWAGEGEQTGVSHEHTVSFSGGTEKFQGYGSFGYLNSEGVIPGQEYERYTMKTSFDAQVLPYLKLGTSMLAAYGMQDYGYSFTKSTTGAGDYYGALQAMLPWTVPYDENGDYIRNPNGDVNIINPIDELNYTTNRRNTFNINGSFYALVDFGKIWSPLEGLTFRSQFSPEFRFYEIGTFNAKDGINGDGNNKASWNKQQLRYWVFDNIINYNKTFLDDHSIGLTLVQSAWKKHVDNQNNSSSNVAMTTELWYNLGSSTSYTLGTGMEETSMASYTARLNYAYQEKYLFQASVRRDGASQLADGYKWDAFPSFSVGWRIEQEDFMESTQNWLDALKLRVGYGISGNYKVGAYNSKGALQPLYQQWGDVVALGYVGSDASAKDPSLAINKTLGWERTKQFNIGIDFAVLDSRLSGNIDFFKNKTVDNIMKKALPSVTGYTQTMDNVGKTRGHGVDIQINGVPVKTRDFAWNVGLSWAASRVYVDELPNGKTEDLTNSLIVDEPLRIAYDYVYDGIWKTGQTVTLADGTTADASTYGRKTGQIKVKDLNGDGKIDGNNDRAVVANFLPDWIAGLTNTFTYKQWELSAFIYARMGFDVRAGALTLDGRYMQRSINYFVEGYNENADYYAPGINGESADTYQGIQNYSDGSYIKVRNINLGYTFNRKQLKKTGLSSVKIYAQCMNPFSIYRATDWFDADFASYANNTKTWAATSATRSFVMGVNIGF